MTTEGNFSINFKLIGIYQHTEPILVAKYKYGTYHTFSFRGGSNIYLNLITCEEKGFIPCILSSYVLH